MSGEGQALSVAALLAQVDALRSDASAAPRLDPVRLHFVESLAGRMQAAPPAVQRVLQGKLEDALKVLGESAGVAPASQSAGQPEAIAASTATAASEEPVNHAAATTRPGRVRSQAKARPVSAPAAPLSRLGELNQYLQMAAQRVPGGAEPGAGAGSRRGISDLKSAVRFRETWARISAEAVVEQAGRRAPENAGPLNPHHLVLRMLGLMRELSPDYLRRFMAHTETMLWLDDAYGQMKQPTGKAKTAKSARTKP